MSLWDGGMSEQLVLLGIAIAAFSGVPGLFFRRSSNAGQWLSVLLSTASSVCGLCGVGLFWGTGDSRPIVQPWAIPGAEFHVAVDGLSAVFLAPIFLIAMLCAVYGLGYWKQTEHPTNGRKLRFFYGLLPAGMALLVIARNSILFMLGWELMALSAFFLVTTEDDVPELRFTGWVYLVATKFATILLIALFSLLFAVSGSFSLVPLAGVTLSHGMATAIFLLTVAGFGLKAGIIPFHGWLPSAHANAPSHVSVIMSGVIIKMGIYGIVRVTSLVPHPPLEWGGILLGLGAISGVLGIVFAISQHDLKRLLAYSSIENIGIIVMGIGLALVGRSLGRADYIILGISGALLHVWNHALFKGLLFFCAGSIMHGVKTREIEKLGGLAKRMPSTSFFFVIGAMAVCGFPMLNGFVSEFLIYLGMFSTLQASAAYAFDDSALVAPVLALIGALAVACFVKVFGIVFLGSARTACSRDAHESGIFMIGPMGILAACCFAIGLAPWLVVPVLAKAVLVWAPELNDVEARLNELAPLDRVGGMAQVLLLALMITSALLWLRLRNSPVSYEATWGCGFAAPTPRIQYTSTSFAEMLVKIFGWVLRVRTHKPNIAELFPQQTSFDCQLIDPVLDEGILPTFDFIADKFTWFRIIQRGNMQAYLMYIFVLLVAMLLL
jgi:hydrogenase-4 component B